MKHSESIAQLAPALVKAQALVKGALRDSTNPYYRTKYADLSSVWEACKEACDQNEIAVVQFPIATTEGVGVETMLLHSSGEYLASEFVLPLAKADAQGGGSCITYARRYAVAAALRVCPEDDDGNAAAQSQRNGQTCDQESKAKALALLEPAARKGLGPLQVAWKSLSPAMQKLVEGEKQRLKALAQGVHATAPVG
jgi:ERF superfamily